jgi:glyceraldehyde 3-phosphate dehydrogenase
MAIRVGINGYGRIGRNILRAHYEAGKKHDLAIVAVNDLGTAEANAHLTRYDTTHGRFYGRVDVHGDVMTVAGDHIKVLAEPEPARIPWGSLGVDVVLECTGRFTTREQAAEHLKAGARRVVISAVAGDDVDATIVYGVNHSTLRPEHAVISNGSCTVNCLAPMAQALHHRIGIVSGVVTNVHGYTNDQALTDGAREDPRRARSATMSMIPVASGVGEAVGLVLPELRGRIQAYGVRVPTINVAMVVLSFVAARDTNEKEVNRILQDASSAGPLAGILNYCTAPLVSVDFNHDPASSTFDATLTKVSGRLVKVAAWYDNEWGYANRMLDTTMALSRARTTGATPITSRRPGAKESTARPLVPETLAA